MSPHLDRLAEQGVVFTDCFASRSQTAPSLASLMTGCYPSTHGVRENAFPFLDGQTTLAEVFAGLGYDTAAFVSYVPAHGRGFPGRGVADFGLGGEIEGKREFPQYDWDSNTVRLAREWLEQRTAERPFFLWVHLYSIHRPYSPPTPYDRMFTGDYAGHLAQMPRLLPHEDPLDRYISARSRDGSGLTAEEHAFVIGLYDGGVRFNDDKVGELLEVLDEIGRTDSTLVVATSDHGRGARRPPGVLLPRQLR